ncbi:hypothetical protein P154DRAFT_440468 [Amniculicola lignicola CBS 123094]|uniref:Uncharacterized protein n=1 Tax=Amniculicola lignicola CBS 123094 TaxID=1392246 RepID=A0A6A5W9E8_9PLEO|nr:hypothetical protein P154DRAFT_440468 [Amniculicola lignicola CBS 123094]
MGPTRRSQRQPNAGNRNQLFTPEPSSNNSFQPAETLHDKRRRWSTLLRDQQYHTVITDVLAEELKKYTNSTVILPTSLSSIIRECILILASAPRIFTAAVDGILTIRFPVDEDIQTEYAEIQTRAHIQPSIYIHLLADENGNAPSPNQYMAIRDSILEYIGDAGSEPASLIDNITPPRVPRSATIVGHRKYIWTTRRSERRVQALQRFCAGILQRYLETPQRERDLPFAHPPGECGYAINSHKRLEQHRRHISSNYIMNLVSDICIHLHRTRQFPQLFYMHQFIIYLIFKPQQIEIAEMFCSGLLQVWVDNGGGFNHYPAGLSNASAKRVSGEQWEEFERYAVANSTLLDTLRMQKDLLESVLRDLGLEEAEAWREALESESENLDDGDGDGDYVNEEMLDD